MLQSSKDANETMRSIQNIIMGSKRDKKIDHPKTILTLDLDEQKQTVRKTRKTRAKIYLRHGEGYKTKLQNFKTLKRPNSKTKTQQGQQKLSQNRDGHKTHKTKEVLTRPNKKSDMSNKLATCDYVH